MFAHLIIKPDHSITLVESEKEHFKYEDLRKDADCDCIENVAVGNPIILNALPFENPLYMVVDDSGMLLGKQPNFIASILYGLHDGIIFGDAVVGILKEWPEPNIYRMKKEDAELLMAGLEALKRENAALLLEVSKGLEREASEKEKE